MATEDPEEFKKNADHFDVIICTAFQNNMDINPFILVRMGGGSVGEN